jgi:hypothetical protein
MQNGILDSAEGFETSWNGELILFTLKYQLPKDLDGTSKHINVISLLTKTTLSTV